MKIVFFLLLAISVMTGISAAKEPISYRDFVSITDSALDALDEVEAVFGSDSFKSEARASLRKFDAALKKYDRYVQTWPEGIQGEIAFALRMSKLLYDHALLQGPYGDARIKAKFAADKSRQLFKLYKDGQGKVDKAAYKGIAGELLKKVAEPSDEEIQKQLQKEYEKEEKEQIERRRKSIN